MNFYDSRNSIFMIWIINLLYNIKLQTFEFELQTLTVLL